MRGDDWFLPKDGGLSFGGGGSGPVRLCGDAGEWLVSRNIHKEISSHRIMSDSIKNPLELFEKSTLLSETKKNKTENIVNAAASDVSFIPNYNG